eukprot:m.52829 g.52829  ORF g.52829 m.52829 type:complete len:78 (+) comp7635_c1_seq1:774-1007(+)
MKRCCNVVILASKFFFFFFSSSHWTPDKSYYYPSCLKSFISRYNLLFLTFVSAFQCTFYYFYLHILLSEFANDGYDE